MNVVSSQQMRTIDRAASTRYGIPPLLLMENAGRSVADFAETMLQRKKSAVAILCGYGNNGGDGFVVARHLANRGYAVDVVLVGERKPMSAEARINFEIIKKMKIKIQRLFRREQARALGRHFRGARLLIDAIFGIGVRGVLSPFYCEAIEQINKSGIPVLAVDIPSGLDADSGAAVSSAIRAQATVAMGLPKKGFLKPSARKYLGRVVVADISLPRQLKS